MGSLDTIIKKEAETGVKQYEKVKVVLEDLASYLKNELNNSEIEIKNEKTNPEEIILTYLDSKNKFIDAKPREVVYSRELRQKVDNKKFIDDQGSPVNEQTSEKIIKLIHIFENKFAKGADITNHLSKGIFKDNEDIILNHWKLRHLHMSETEVNASWDDMSKNRSSWLLFFIINMDKVYFIDVVRHPKGAGFTAFKFIDIIHNNGWMKIIGFESMGDEYVPYSLKPNVKNDEDIYVLYKDAKVNIAFDIRGRGYVSLDGVTRAGFSSMNIMMLKRLEKDLRKTVDSYDYISLSGLQGTGKVQLKFRNSNNSTLMLELDFDNFH